MRNGKFIPHQGGCRLSCIIGNVGFVTADNVSNEQISTFDLIPIIASLLGLHFPEYRPIDGINISSMFIVNSVDPLLRDCL